MLKKILLYTVMTGMAQAGVSNWPSESAWMPIFTGADYYTDIGHDAINTGKDDENLDIVGNPTLSAGFKHVQTENGEEQLLFRIRLDDYKKTAQPRYWQIYFNTDSDADLDFALELESRLDNDQYNQWLEQPKLRFTSVAANGTTTAIRLSTANLWAETAGENYARWGGLTPEGDAFIDLAMPAAEFYAATGLTPGRPYSIMLATSRTSGLIDGDIALHDGSVPAPTQNLSLFVPPKPGYVEALYPNQAGQLGGTRIVINGTDLGNGTRADIQYITLNGIEVASIDSVSATQIVVSAAASGMTGTGDLVISSTERDIITKENAFTYAYEVPSRTLTVQSDHGTPAPTVGFHEFEHETAITLNINSPLETGTTQYVCTGWAMSDGTGGDTATFHTTITNDIELTWEWTTNYWVSGSDTTTTSGWFPAGQTIEVIPAERNYYNFAGWSGDTSSTNTPLKLIVEKPINISAEYTEARTENTKTPIWWLAEMGYTQDFENAAVADADGDQVSNWKEYIAGTDARDKNSTFRLKINSASNGGRKLIWNGKKDRKYTIFWGTDLQNPITNTLVENYIPAESGDTSIIDPRPTRKAMFYRIVVSLDTSE